MDVIFVAGIAGLWAAMVALVWGLKKLEAPQGERPCAGDDRLGTPQDPDAGRDWPVGRKSASDRDLSWLSHRANRPPKSVTVATGWLEASSVSGVSPMR